MGLTKEHIKFLRETKAFKAQLDAEPKPEKPAFDLHHVYSTLSKSEKHQIDTSKQESHHVMRWLRGVRYELENNMSSFDWLQMYARVLGSVDFNDIIEDYHYSIQRHKAREMQT